MASYTSNKSIKIHTAKSDRTERRNRQIYNHSQRLQYPSNCPEKSSRQKSSKYIDHLNSTVNQHDLKFLEYSIQKNKPYILSFYSTSYGTFTQIGYSLGHKTHHNKFKTIAIKNIFSDHNGIKEKSKSKRQMKNPPKT